MADRYYVAAGNWSDDASWSASSGGAGGASHPVTGDNVYLDANSPAAAALTLDADAACAILSVLDGFEGTFEQAGFTLTAERLLWPPNADTTLHGAYAPDTLGSNATGGSLHFTASAGVLLDLSGVGTLHSIASDGTFGDVIVETVSDQLRTIIGPAGAATELGLLRFGLLDYTLSGSSGDLVVDASPGGRLVFVRWHFSDAAAARDLILNGALEFGLADEADAFDVHGTEANRVGLHSAVGGTAASLNYDGTRLYFTHCDYLDVQDIDVVGVPLAMYPGIHSLDRGGNAGWAFPAQYAGVTVLPYDATVSYNRGQVVVALGTGEVIVRSKQNGNTGNDPGTDIGSDWGTAAQPGSDTGGTWWLALPGPHGLIEPSRPSVDVYDPATTYASGDNLRFATGVAPVIYESRYDLNLDHDPTDPANAIWWKQLT